MKALCSDRQSRLSEASEWVVRLRSNPESESTVNEWLLWCEQSAENGAAFEEIQRLWTQMGQAYPDPSEVERLLAGTNRPQRLSTREWWRESVFMRFSARIPRYVLGASLAALLLLAAGSVGWWTSHRASDSAPLQAGARSRTVTLPDGSVVDLAPRTSVIVSFGGGERRLALATGEAFFKVHPDRSRPFVVNAGHLDVTAVGTAFDVKRSPGVLTVTVEEGVVSATPLDQTELLSRGAAWKVGPGSRLVLSESDGAATLSSIQSSAAFSWRDGRLEYINAPLSTVVDDVNRYASYPLEITDDSVSRLTFTGTVFTASVDSWLRALPGALPVRVERQPDGARRIVSDPRN